MQAKLRMDDDQYRAALSAYDAPSSTGLSYEQAGDFIRSLEAMAAKNNIAIDSNAARARRATGRKKYDELAARPGTWASPAQMRMLEAMWADVSRMKNADARERALNNFLSHHYGISHITFVQRSMVRKIVRAIEVMRYDKAKREQELQHEEAA